MRFRILYMIRLVTIVCLLVLITSCASIKTGSHYSDETFMRGQKTFAWISKDPILISDKETLVISPITLKLIVLTVQEKLMDLGYVYVDHSENADFVMSYTVGSREKFSADLFPRMYRNDWQWYWEGDYHNVSNWHMQSWTEGTLTIDIFDNLTKKPVWHGWATKMVTEKDRKSPSKAVKKAIEKVFSRFPINANHQN